MNQVKDAIDLRKKRLQNVAWLLDNSIPIPLTSRKIGLDSVIGLIPGLGDAIGGILSTWILLQGIKLEVPKLTLLRMVMNVAIEVVIGFIPFVGDLFDMVWKANDRNVQLLGSYIDRPVSTARGSVIWVFFVLLSLLLIGCMTVWLGIGLFKIVIVWTGQLIGF